jgi:hypothetical protein
MRSALIRLAILASFIRHERAEDKCTEGPYQGAQYAYAGLPFPTRWNDAKQGCGTRWSSQNTVIGIEAWATHDHVEGIRSKYELSGWGPLRGNEPPETVRFRDYERKEWKAGDKVCEYFLQPGSLCVI